MNNKLLQELFENIPQDIQDSVNKSMTCKYLINGNECSFGKKKLCNPIKCVDWKYYKK